MVEQFSNPIFIPVSRSSMIHGVVSGVVDKETKRSNLAATVYHHSILNIYIFNAPSIGIGLVVAELLCMKRENILMLLCAK